MKRTLSLIAGVLCLAMTAPAQSFINLDFEQANSFTIDPEATFISWNIAAGGWQHPSGQNTTFVNHLSPQTTDGQYYLLVDSFCGSLTPLSGNYSLAFSGGYFGGGQSGGFVNAYISQTALVPNDAVTFRMWGTGNFSVLLDSTVIPMVNLGGNLYAGVVAGFAGTTHALRIRNESTSIMDPVEIDDMTFSTTSIPEPSTLALMASGIGALLIAARRRR